MTSMRTPWQRDEEEDAQHAERAAIEDSAEEGSQGS